MNPGHPLSAASPGIPREHKPGEAAPLFEARKRTFHQSSQHRETTAGEPFSPVGAHDPAPRNRTRNAATHNQHMETRVSIRDPFPLPTP